MKTEISEGWTADCHRLDTCPHVCQVVQDNERLTAHLRAYDLPWYRWLWVELSTVFQRAKIERTQQ